MIHAVAACSLKHLGTSIIRRYLCMGFPRKKIIEFHADLFRGCSRIQNMPDLLSHTFTDFHLGLCGRRSFCRELISTPSVTAQHKTGLDLLLENLTSTSSTSDVLEIVGAHHSIMNNRHSIQALQSLFEHQRSSRTSMSNQEVITSPEFIVLCKRLKSQARGIELNEVIQALKMVTYLGLPSSSLMSQVLLQLIRHNVNVLSLQHIVFLDFLLKRMDSCPLVEALKIALPLVFESQLSIKLDHTNMPHLAEMLQYASRKPVSSKSFEIIVKSLTTLIDGQEKMDVRTAKTIIWSICDNQRTGIPVGTPLHRALEVLAESIDQCSFDDVDTILGKLVRRIVRKHGEFYHEDFMDSCVSFIIKKDSGFEYGTWILRKLSRIGHISIQLLNYLSEKVVANPSILEQCKPHILFTLVTGFSTANYRPANWDIISNIILNNRLLEEGKVELPWLKFALELAALDCYSPSLLKWIFQEDFLKQFLSREYNILDHLQLLLLHQAVVTLQPSYTGPFPPPAFIEKAVAYNGENVDQFPLEGALTKGLGGPAYVHTKLYTRLGHCVDHVIVMRKGGFPVALGPGAASRDDPRTIIEDLEIPEDSQIVAVMGLYPGCYSVNCSRLRGQTGLLLRSLEACNLLVVPVSLQVWSRLPDHEKIPFLMQEIKIKSNTSEHVSALL